MSMAVSGGKAGLGHTNVSIFIICIFELFIDNINLFKKLMLWISKARNQSNLPLDLCVVQTLKHFENNETY